MKKDALVAEAERRMSGSGWLPTVLCKPAPEQASAALDQAAE